MASPFVQAPRATPEAPRSTDPRALEPDGPLRVAVLAKQVPVAEHLRLGPDRRLCRDGIPLEMNPYCRRAVAQGVELARASGGTCTVFTLGPPSAEEVLREAVAWGADRGVHLCDLSFAGSDSLATASALAAAIQLEGPFDLVLAGRNSIDGETGQVMPEIAELLDLPFAGAVRALALDGRRMRLRLEHDDGWEEVATTLPAVLTAAERLCTPCKVGPEGRRAVDPGRIELLTSDDLGPGPWGREGSPTRVGALRLVARERAGVVLGGDLRAQVAEAVAMLQERGALDAETDGGTASEMNGCTAEGAGGETNGGTADGAGDPVCGYPSSGARSSGLLGVSSEAATMVDPPVVAVVLDRYHHDVGAELLGAARDLAHDLGGVVVAWRQEGAAPEPAGADRVVELVSRTHGPLGPEDMARALSVWASRQEPWAILAPGTAWGREVAARTAASLRCGLVGDAIDLALVDGELVAAKPAFSGALVADISCRSPVRLVTVRPGVLPLRRLHGPQAPRARLVVDGRGRVTTLERGQDDDVETLSRASVVIGVGAGVLPHEYELLDPLAEVLGAVLAATRKVTDKGWVPRARQVGITGRSIAPRLYLALALSGTFNHVVGARGAQSILAVNVDPGAPVFTHADVGIVGDWHEVVPLLEAELRDAGARTTTRGRPRSGVVPAVLDRA